MIIFSSTVIYIGTIFATIIIAMCFQNIIKVIRNKNCIERNILIFIVIVMITLPLTMLSAMRGNSVGVDTYNHIAIFESAAMHTSFWDFYHSRGREELLYCLFTYITKNVTNSRFLYLWGLQFLALGPIVKIAIDEMDEVPLWKPILIYECWYFTDSLNAMRQSVAVAFLLLMFRMISHKKYKQGIICLLIACGFHSSAVFIGFILIGLYYILSSKVGRKLKYAVLILCFFIISFGQNIIVYIFNLGFMPSRWILYINTFIFQNSRMTERWQILSKGHYFELIIRGVVLISFLFLCNKFKYQKSDMIKYEYIYILNVLIYAVGIIVYHTGYAVRMSVYFDAFVIYLFPILDEKFRLKIRSGDRRIPVFSAIYSVMYCFVHSILMGSGGAIPYVLY